MSIQLFGRRVAAGCLVLGLGLAAFAAPASAFVDEVRGGVFAHDPFRSGRESDHADINVEMVFESPAILSWAGKPRPRLGGTLSGSGGTSLVYLDVLGWTFDLGGNVFADFGLGGAIHDGDLNGNVPGKLYFGCRANFHQSGSIGYRITPELSVMASIEHMSNGSLCSKNDGLTNIGVRFGYSF
ncbi:acyloxyacyl hydrolase [Parvibaculum sp.]|uniref:acyloxyacyl hydrolase n=1 Tax=Parvibaculum sp. TaxID=2024848 RepID=UPI002A33CE19|nr:acyloxyacyl hydrolase [Parvibaculum sp.]